MTTPDVQLDRPLDRRFLIRGGAVLAGAASAGVIGAALSPTTAHAVDGDNVILGDENASSSATSVTIGGTIGSSNPTLALNNANGPSLALEALPEFDGSLRLGEIVNTRFGPDIGVDYGEGTVSTFLATGADLTNTYPIPVERLLDTGSAASRAERVVDASTGTIAAAFDPLGRLRGGTYIDVAIAPTEDLDLIGLFLNLTVSRPTEGGYLELYTPGGRPKIPSITYQRLITVTNSIFIGPGVSESGEDYLVRIYTSRATRVIVDLLGAVTGFRPSAPVAAATVPDRRQLRQAKQRARLIKSIKAR